MIGHATSRASTLWDKMMIWRMAPFFVFVSCAVCVVMIDGLVDDGSFVDSEGGGGGGRWRRPCM